MALVLLFAGFALASAAVWLAGIRLSNATDVLSMRLGLGEALGGAILLAVATNLPEIAIVTTAAIAHNLEIATGNILGGIAIQTVVLAVLDGFGVATRRSRIAPRRCSSSSRAHSSSRCSRSSSTGRGSRPMRSTFRLTVPAVLIFVVWLVGLWLLGRAQQACRGTSMATRPTARGTRAATGRRWSSSAARRHAGGARVRRRGAGTLAGGVALERLSESISTRIGLSGVLFGATVLAAATALPEVSTGLQSLKLGDYQLAVSDIFGGNAFLPVLFLPATLISG